MGKKYSTPLVEQKKKCIMHIFAQENKAKSETNETAEVKGDMGGEGI